LGLLSPEKLCNFYELMSGSTDFLDLTTPNNEAVILAELYLGEATPGTIALSDLIAYADKLTPVIIEQERCA